TTLSPVVVTATRTETPVAETAASITVITAEEIEQRQAETVTDVLRSIPGLDIAQTGSRGTTTTVFTRGAESDQTLVLIDGVEVNGVTAGLFDSSNLTTENIDRIEVLRGGGGTLYGSQAVGGVINIITKKGEGRPTISVSAEGGNGSTHREVLTFSGGHGIVGFSGAVASIDTDGFRSVNDGHRNFSTNLRLDVTPIPTGAFRAFFRYTDTKTNLFNNKNYLGVPDLNARQLSNSLLLKGEWEQTVGDAFNYRVAGSYVRDNQRFFDEPDRFDEFGSGISRIPTKIFTGEMQANYAWRDVSVLTFGFEFEDKSADVESNFGGFRTRYNKGRNNFAYYFQEQLRLLDERLFIVGGVRVDDNEDFGTHVTPAGSIAYLIPSLGTKFKGGVSNGFRAPNFNELFFPDFGNPDLGAELSSEWNIGFEQSLWDNLFSLEAVYFERRVKGLIEGVLIDPDNFVFQAQNKGRVDIQGVEVIPVLRPLPDLTLSGSFLFLDFVTSDGKLLRRPSERGTLHANYQRRDLWWEKDQLNLHLGLRVVGDRDDVDPSSGTTRANGMFATTNMAISYSFPSSLAPLSEVTVYGKIENLFDREYEETLGFRAPPLNYLIGMKATF
ncbi:MAG: TonB-dependent receptor, partial [Deltaproteobacteria bacterium]|nr:TonB-dependent receptor [Deltaproteobacteria bacterium]